MLKKTILICAIVPLYLSATTIISLLNVLEKRPENKLDMLNVQKSSLQSEMLSDKLMPTVNIFAGYEMYNSPNGMLPVAPNKLIHMIQDQSIGQPFSKQIAKEGVTFTWPLFVKSIYTLKDKADLLHLASKQKHRLNLLQRQAMVVGLVAQLRYLESLQNALESKKRSILETSKTTKLMVKEGRLPKSALFVLNSHINDIDIALNSILQNINIIKSKIETMTNIHLKRSMPLRAKHRIKRKEIFALKSMRSKLQASKKAIQAAHEAYMPSVLAKGNYSYSQADAYNNDKMVHEEFGMAGIYLSMPLFDSSKGTAIQMAKIDYMTDKMRLMEVKHSLEVKAKELDKEISLLYKSLRLAKKSVTEQKKLLKIAKVSLQQERMTQEEYLRYENALASAKANLYSIEAKLWEDKAQLAVIYGNNLKEIVR